MIQEISCYQEESPLLTDSWRSSCHDLKICFLQWIEWLQGVLQPMKWHSHFTGSILKYDLTRFWSSFTLAQSKTHPYRGFSIKHVSVKRLSLGLANYVNRSEPRACKTVLSRYHNKTFFFKCFFQLKNETEKQCIFWLFVWFTMLSRKQTIS